MYSANADMQFCSSVISILLSVIQKQFVVTTLVKVIIYEFTFDYSFSVDVNNVLHHICCYNKSSMLQKNDKE